MRWLGFGAALAAAGTVFAIFACSSDPSEPPPEAVDAGADVPFVRQCDLHCSPDLHDVVDCDNKVLRHCSETEGCTLTGGCAPACESARVNKSTVGCEYYAVGPATDGFADGSCYAAFVANTWSSPVQLSVNYDGKDLDVSQFARIPTGSGAGITSQPLPQGTLPAGQVAILFLADFSGTGDGGAPIAQFPTRCPAGVNAAVSTTVTTADTSAIVKAFSIKSSAPVVAYDIFPYGGAKSYISSATLLVPTPAWGDNYVAVTAYPKVANPSIPLQQPFVQIAAADDGTTVTVRPSVPIAGGPSVAPGAAGAPSVYNLAKGQVLQLKQDEDLSGSIIQANKPVGVWGGNSCMAIETNESSCDSGHQQLFPAKALGSKYVALKHKDRLPGVEEAPPWRIVGVVDGTQLTYEPFTPPGAPTAVRTGEVIHFRAAGPLVIKSQDNAHPFYLSGHMTAQKSSGQDFGVGDPEFVNMVATEQYLRSYVFMTDPTMKFTNLALVRVKGPNGFADVELDCGGKVAGWQGVGNDGTLQVARYDLVAGGVPLGQCDNGRHTIKSDQPFGLTVWGWDYTVSYAYPAGASVRPINEVVVPAVK